MLLCGAIADFTVPLSAVAENSAPYSFDTAAREEAVPAIESRGAGAGYEGVVLMGANSAIQLTFGITQVVYVNDELVAQTQLLPAVNQALGTAPVVGAGASAAKSVRRPALRRRPPWVRLPRPPPADWTDSLCERRAGDADQSSCNQCAVGG